MYSHRGESAGSRKVELVWPVGTAAAVFADKVPAPSAAAPPDSLSSSPKSFLEEAVVGLPSSPLSADTPHTHTPKGK